MPRWRRRVWDSVRRIAFGLITLLLIEYLVLPQLAGARKSLHLLSKVNFGYLIAGLALEAGAIVAYAQLTRSVLPRASRPSRWRILRIDLTTLSVSHLVPGGSAAGASLGYRLLTDAGVSGADAGFALATQGIGSAVVLNVLLWLGLLISIPVSGFNALYGTAAVVGALLLGAFAGVILLLTRGEDRAASILRTVAAKVPFLDENVVEGIVRRLADRVEELATDRNLLQRGVAWAATNWVLDMASLWVFLAAFGHRVNPVSLVVAFGLANVLAAIPITPGGLGVVEAVLTSTLVGFGTPSSIAILGVITYRLVNFWLPIPVGAGAYVSLQVGSTGSRARKAAELRRIARDSVEDAEDTRAWAARHGVKVAERDPRAQTADTEQRSGDMSAANAPPGTSPNQT